MSLSKSASTIKKADEAAFARRVMWSSLDERIKGVFDIFSAQEPYISTLGNIYLTRSRDYDPIRTSGLLSFQYVNSTYIHTGHRLLGANTINIKDSKFEIAKEWNCQFWYAQGLSGDVLVFMAPYESNAGKIEEKEIVIGKYKEPALITTTDIQKHFNVFFRYCACTSQNNSGSLLSYLYRQYLIYNDFRYNASFKAKFIKVAERIILLLLGASSIWAALYVGGKI